MTIGLREGKYNFNILELNLFPFWIHCFPSPSRHWGWKLFTLTQCKYILYGSQASGYLACSMTWFSEVPQDFFGIYRPVEGGLPADPSVDGTESSYSYYAYAVTLTQLGIFQYRMWGVLFTPLGLLLLRLNRIFLYLLCILLFILTFLLPPVFILAQYALSLMIFLPLFFEKPLFLLCHVPYPLEQMLSCVPPLPMLSCAPPLTFWVLFPSLPI